MTFEYLYFWILWFSFPLHTKLTVFEKAISIIHPWGALLPSPSEKVYCSFSLSLLGGDMIFGPNWRRKNFSHGWTWGWQWGRWPPPTWATPPTSSTPASLSACLSPVRFFLDFSLITHTHTHMHIAHTYHISIQDLYTRLYTIYILRILWYKLPQIHYEGLSSD